MHELSAKRVLITGGAGFVGSHIADVLVEHEDVQEVVLLDNMLRGSRRNVEHLLAGGRVRLVEGDIRDTGLLDRLVADADYVFHMAALRISRCAENPREALEVMYGGTFNVLEACVRHHVTKLVAASSASVYGTADSFPTKEDHHPYNNNTFYGGAKTALELMCRSFRDMYGLDYNAVRYFNVYGPRMDTEGKYTEVLIRWYDRITQGQAPLIYGAGEQTMDFVHVRDVARATVLALKAETTNEVFNVGCGRETSLLELSQLLLDAMGSTLSPEKVPIPEERQKVEVARRLADISKAADLIGFEAEIRLEDGLKDLVRWLNGLRATHGR